MILKLHKGDIIIKGNYAPEDIYHTQIQYEYELGTNHLYPILHIENHVYEGNDVVVSFDYNLPQINIQVLLCDGNHSIIKRYSHTFELYKTFTLGTPQHVDIYKAYVEALKRIQQLEDEREVI